MISILRRGYFFFNKSSSDFSQLIHEPTRTQANISSCIDLVFTDQPNLSFNSAVHASLQPNCHHQIGHYSFNLNIYYPSQYQRLIWNYKKPDPKNIRKAFDSVNWERIFDLLFKQYIQNGRLQIDFAFKF